MKQRIEQQSEVELEDKDRDRITDKASFLLKTRIGIYANRDCQGKLQSQAMKKGFGGPASRIDSAMARRVYCRPLYSPPRQHIGTYRQLHTSEIERQQPSGSKLYPDM